MISETTLIKVLLNYTKQHSNCLHNHPNQEIKIKNQNKTEFECYFHFAEPRL